MTPARRAVCSALPWLTGVWLLVELASLRLGVLDAFFFDAMHADVQGIDYFSLPKAFLNLTLRRSAYDTFAGPAYGPHITWYLAHPALAVWLGSWLSLLSPSVGYGIYTLLSVAMMGGCAGLMAEQSKSPLVRRTVWLLLLGAFPTYWMLYVGNVQGLLVLALGMLFTGVFTLTYGGRGRGLVLGGLLLSLLTKPLVLPMLPLLLMLKETRRAAWRALAIYAAVSIAMEVAPLFNPQAIGLRNVAWLALHPSVVRDTMNIYTNRFQVIPSMKDNSVHWLNLVAQSGTRLMHVDVFSLPVFLDTLLGRRTPGWEYQLPVAAVLALSVGVARMKHPRVRLEAALLLLMAASLTFFLGYPTVWEYQYTSVLPVAAMLLLVRERGVFYRSAWGWMLALAGCAWLPSFYFLAEGRLLTRATLTLIRADRVVPATLLFLVAVGTLALAVVSEDKAGRAA
jgi:hypothetical protein